MDERPVLNYANREPRRRMPWWAMIVWFGSSAVIWRYADWWAYVVTGPSRWRKFEMPLWFQIGMSLFQGFLIAVAVFILYLTGRWCGRQITRQCNGPEPRV